MLCPGKRLHSMDFFIFRECECMPMTNLVSLTTFENVENFDLKRRTCTSVRLWYFSTCLGLLISDFDVTCALFFILESWTYFL